tara:strand:+ start:252 stop:512 length:261 start_codon:yes stop_codon:yes gene_type:complete
MENVHKLPNLQLLEDIINQEKRDTDFVVWLATNVEPQRKKEYMHKHLIPETNHSLPSFRLFFEERKAKVKSELCKVLSVDLGNKIE